MNTNFKVIGLNRLGIKLKSTAPEPDALTTRPSELLYKYQNCAADVSLSLEKFFALGAKPWRCAPPTRDTLRVQNECISGKDD